MSKHGSRPQLSKIRTKALLPEDDDDYDYLSDLEDAVTLPVTDDPQSRTSTSCSIEATNTSTLTSMATQRSLGGRQKVKGKAATPGVVAFRAFHRKESRILSLDDSGEERLPLRRHSWIAIGGGEERETPMLRVSNDDLQEAALRGDVGLVRRLVHEGASVNSPMRPENGDDFMTLLHILASKPDLPNSARLIAEVIRMKANLDARSTSGSTPLASACFHAHCGAVEVLLDAKADPIPIDDHGRNALVCCLLSQSRASAQEAKKYLSVPGKPMILEDIAAGVEIIGLLAKAGADLNYGGDFVPIVKAIDVKEEEFVRSLIQNGAKAAGLHEALESAPVGVIRALTEAEVNPFTRSPVSGKTPMDIALARGQGDILTLLRDYIGDLQRVNHAFLETQKEELLISTRLEEVAAKHAGRGSMGRKFSAETGNSHQARRKGWVGAVSSVCPIISEKIAQKYLHLQAQCRKLLKNKTYGTVMMSTLIVALFLPDMWVLLDIADTISLDILLTMILLLFTTEFVVQIIGLGKSYRFTFFFYMDLLGVLSVPLDHSIINNMLQGNATDNTTVLRAARMAKLGARAGRFTKLLKLLRFLPGVKEQGAHAGTAKVIASKLNTALSTRVSCLIITMVMVLPVCDLFMYPNSDESMKVWLDVIQGTFVEFTPDVSELLDDFKAFYAGKTYYPYEITLVDADGKDHVFLLGERPNRYQAESKTILKDAGAFCMFNFEEPARADSVSNVLLIITIMTLILTASFFLSNAISAVVIVPLEDLLSDVKRITGSIFDNVNKMSKKKKPQVVDLGEQVEVDSSDDDNMEDAFGNETQGLEIVLKKLGVLSQIMTMKPMAGNDDMGEEVRCWLRDYASNEERASYVPDGESGDSEDSPMPKDPEELRKDLEDRLFDVELSYDTYNTRGLSILDQSEVQQKCICICAITEHRQYLFSDDCGDELDWGEVVGNFVDAIEKGHDNSNPYHNFTHAADVCHSVKEFLRVCRAELFFNQYERLALVVGALAHDLGHPGLSSAHLMETGHELAMLYNDHSPLENMHCAKLFDILSHPDSAIFCDLSARSYKEVRHCVIDAVLKTDSRYHTLMCKDIQTLYDINHDLFDIGEILYRESYGQSYPVTEVVDFFKGADVKKQIRDMVLHYCDVSNSTKFWPTCQAWANLAQQEFFLQGDREKALGLPVAPLNDRERGNLGSTQTFIIEFYVAPLALPVERLLPPLSAYTDALFENYANWIKEFAKFDPQQKISLLNSKPSPEDEAKLWERITRLEERRASGGCRGQMLKRESFQAGMRMSATVGLA